MLGKDRFASFETPNVIDPGDDAPLQPKRKQQQQQQSPSGGSSTTSPSAPPSYRPVGVGRSEKIDFNGNVNNRNSGPPRLLNNIDDLNLHGYYNNHDNEKKTPSTSEDEDDDDHSEGASSSSQAAADASMERARNYAATLLKDANRRTTTTTTTTTFDVMGSEEPSNAPAATGTSSRLILMGHDENDAAYGQYQTTTTSKHLVRNRVLNVTAKAVALLGLLILVVLFVLRVAS